MGVPALAKEKDQRRGGSQRHKTVLRTAGKGPAVVSARGMVDSRLWDDKMKELRNSKRFRYDLRASSVGSPEAISHIENLRAIGLLKVERPPSSDFMGGLLADSL